MGPFLTLLAGVVPAIVQGIQNRQSHKAELQKIQQTGELEIEKARMTAEIKRVQDGEALDADMDMASVKERGYKDDLLLYLTIIPLVLCFIPSMTAHVVAGFEALKASVPEWYLWVVALIYIDTFGFRRLLRGPLERFFTGRFVGK